MQGANVILFQFVVGNVHEGYLRDLIAKAWRDIRLTIATERTGAAEAITNNDV